MKRETMTGEELRTAIKALGLTYREAAECLGLTLDGLNKQMRGVRPVGRQTELLLGYVEEAVERASAAEAAPPLRSRRVPAFWEKYPVPKIKVRGPFPPPWAGGPRRRG